MPCATCPLCRVLPRPLSTLRQPEPAWLLRAVAGALRGCDPIARRGATDSPLRCARSAAAPLRRRGPDPAGWIARQRGSRAAAQSWASFFVPAGPRTPRPRCSRFLFVWSDFSLIGPGAMPCASSSSLPEPGRFAPRPLFSSPRPNPRRAEPCRCPADAYGSGPLKQALDLVVPAADAEPCDGPGPAGRELRHAGWALQRSSSSALESRWLWDPPAPRPR